MRQSRTVALATVCFLLTQMPLLAQSWSEQQSDVLAMLEEMWQADASKDPTWIDRLTLPELLGWGREEPSPQNQSQFKRWVDYGYENGTTLVHDLSPVGIAVHGDAAVAHYFVTVVIEDQAGERTKLYTRCTDTLARDNASWRLLGWSCVDAAPGGD